MRRTLWIFGLALWGCGSDDRLGPAPVPAGGGTAPAEVSASPPVSPVEAPVAARPRDAAPALVAVDPGEGPGAARRVREDRALGIREERFAAGAGATSPVVDFLFVVDHSVSMDRITDRVRAGMLSLVEEGSWPAKARIAVMSTLPGDPADLDRPHPAAVRTAGLERDPGFLRLVDGAGIAAYRQAAPIPVAERFAMEGCDPWFAPDQTNAAGEPCLLAHTQIGGTPVGVEAGLVALDQFLARAEAPVFRPGAAVNVVFVSDTHDPGIALDALGAADLGTLRPDFDRLRERIEANSLVSGVRVHAIAPASECVERWADGPTYREVALASGGVAIDVCRATDYRPLLRRIARSGAVVQRPVFPLGRPARQVESVELDGRPIPYAISPDGRVLVLDGLAPGERAEVAVRYRWR